MGPPGFEPGTNGL